MERIVGFEIKSLDNMITRKILADTKLTGKEMLSPVQIKILRYLFLNKDHDVYQRDIEKNFLVRRSTASGILRTMEKRGLIKRIGSDTDLRVKKVILSSECINRIDELEARTISFQDKLCSGITDEELILFFRIIDKMKDNLS